MALYKYYLTARTAAMHQLSQKGELGGRLMVYVVVVYLFYQVFVSVSESADRLWYLAVTEWIILSAPPLASKMEEEIQGGQLSYFLLRPAEYLYLKFFEGLGVFLVRFVIIGIACMALGYGLSGQFPVGIGHWPGIALGVFLGIILYQLLLMLIGLSAFWVQHVMPFAYLNLTATFAFGGLIIPLSYYPEAWYMLSFLTPYPWILWWPAHWVSSSETFSLFPALFAWIFWCGLLVLALRFLFQKRMKTMVIDGG